MEKEKKNKGGRPPLSPGQHRERMQISMRPQDIEALAQRADQEGITRSELVRSILLKYLRSGSN